MSPKKAAKKPAKRTSASGTGLSAEERAALKETLKERKAAASKEEAVAAALEAIKAMEEPDRSMALRLHELIMASAPTLLPRTWYGMPAYSRDGNVVCFFQSAQKFKARYATLGFSDKANLDDGAMWPTSFALKRLSSAEETMITALLKKAVS